MSGILAFAGMFATTGPNAVPPFLVTEATKRQFLKRGAFSPQVDSHAPGLVEVTCKLAQILAIPINLRHYSNTGFGSF